jgi:Ser/Thr protein kinase RdoA (MazF antagonist)
VTATSDIDPRVLAAWPELAGGAARPFGAGLINTTWLVEAGAARAVLQRVNPIFPAAIHENIRAVTERLAAAGLVTPRLLPTRAGALCLDLGAAGLWRAMSLVEGVCHEVVATPAQAHSAGALVARFHAALAGLRHAFVGMRVGVHDTPRHLERLAEALGRHAGHRLHGPVAALAGEVLAGAAALPRLPDLPPVTGHGDLKFNNILFAGAVPPASEEARCLIDLDTVGPVLLAYELGDAWRSWCNRSGEDQSEAVLDLEVFRASLAGYRAGLGRPLTEAERRALLLGVEWVSLELTARFAADALAESYFGWDATRYPGRGEHNLVRARGQWSLHRALGRGRGERARELGVSAA